MILDCIFIGIGLYRMIHYSMYQLSKERLESITLFLSNQFFINNKRIIVGPIVYTGSFQGKAVKKRVASRHGMTKDSIDLRIDPQTLMIYEADYVESWRVFVGMIILVVGIAGLFY
ncbi:MAG: hypothetical protein ACI4SR_05905 [Faecalibacillus sp.]